MKFTFGDADIFYETFGAGRPLVLLPGQPSSHHSLASFIEPVFAQRAGWQRIYLDLPGTGQSTVGEAVATPDKLLDAMLAFIEAVIPGQRFTLAGLSYGGYLARGILQRHVELIDGLLLCVPMIKADEAQAQLPPRATIVANPALLAQLPEGERPLVASMVVAQTPQVVAATREVFAEVGVADHAFLTRLEADGGFTFDVDALPAPFEAPTLLLTGRQDNICGYRDAWELLANYPRATFAVLDRAGHFATIEQEALCHPLIGEWLNRVEEWSAAR
ncbi:MAG TPA: alpha/beta hydrolase, partial [Ktedonobacterales bacterium]